MKQSEVIEAAIRRHQPNELILASKLYREQLAGEVSETAYYKTLERMCKAGGLTKAAKGTYYLQKTGAFGVVPLSEREIVSAFTGNGAGTVIGYALYNRLGLTTQMSKRIEVLSSALDAQTKTIRNVSIEHCDLHFSKEIAEMVHALEVLQNYGEIQDINSAMMLEYSKEIAGNYTQPVFDEVISKRKYAKSTIAFLREILNYYGRENNLSRHLSSLSTYKHPKMEALYEAARLPQ